MEAGLNGITSSKRIRIEISTDFADSFSKAKKLLQELNLTIYYILDTPEYIHITSINYPTLYSQLENLYNNIKSYAKQTEIKTITLDENNKNMEIDVVALKNIDIIESE